MLHEEKELIEWMNLHVGAERGVNCEHMQVSLTNLLQKHWEWQENRRKDWEPGKFRYKTMYMASLDVKTAFDVARPSVVSKILSLIGTHGHVVAALLAEMQDVKGSACFETCETEFRSRRGGSTGSVVTGCKISPLESRRKVESQRVGDYLLEEKLIMNMYCGA